MKNIVYVTGNENKAKYFSRMVGVEIPLPFDEIWPEGFCIPDKETRDSKRTPLTGVIQLARH